MNISFNEFGSGQPVVLLHAFPLSKKMWTPQIEALANEGFRVITPDLRGFGDTESFADINQMEEMAKDVKDLLDILKIEKAIVGGLSMGGYVVFNFYRLFPHKTAALIFADTSPDPDSPEKQETRKGLIDQIEKSGSQALIDQMLSGLLSRATKETKPEIVEEIEKMFLETKPKGAIAALRGMAARKNHNDLLADISVPVLLIFGKDDTVTAPATGAKLHSEIPHAKLSVLEQAGHYSNLEQSELFNDALTTFCRSVEF